MDFLNSQHLTYQDGYVHVFRSPGTYTYRCLILPRDFATSSGGSDYTIEVKDTGRDVGKGTQNEIVMRWDGKTYQPEPAKLAIGVNDFVMWRVESQSAAVPPYSILGASKDAVAFDSRALAQHDVFTHLFMTPGLYRLSLNGAAVGQINVRDHREMKVEEYDKQLQNAVLIHVTGGKIDPASADIAAGQTVVWFVEDGNAVTITAAVDTTQTGAPKA